MKSEEKGEAKGKEKSEEVGWDCGDLDDGQDDADATEFCGLTG